MEEIENKLGNFISLEDWETKVDSRCAKIMVEMDITEAIYEELLENSVRVLQLSTGSTFVKELH